MEANRDSALHYLELAEKAIHVNDVERAVRYINKSEDLYPTQKAKGINIEMIFISLKLNLFSIHIRRSVGTNKKFQF